MKRLIPALLLGILFPGPALTARNRQDADRALTDRVAKWQIEHFDTVSFPLGHWTNAALYRGMAEWAARTNADFIYDFLREIGRKSDWDMPPRIYDADDLCVGQTYFELSEKYDDPRMIAKVKDRVDYIMAHPQTGSLRLPNGKYNRNRWGWCDALFMAPPVYVQLYLKTEKRDYLDFCTSEYKVTVDSLFDRNDNLFYRDLRLVNDREKNGKKVFWGRGNGWVYAGLALMLQRIPKDDPVYSYYLDLFLKMSPAVLRCQDKAGSWHSSLYAPEYYPQPENSASGFFVYGMAWGVNHGILGKEYRKAAQKGWNALKSHVNGEGKLGYVQSIGHAPVEISGEMTAVYGVGAFLLAASEMMEMNL